MTKQFPKGIQDNLRFLCVEVDSQVAHLQEYFNQPSTLQARRILDRSGYAYNLKLRIHDGCIRMLSCCEEGCAETMILRAVEFIATGLERITQLCRDCIKQMEYLDDRNCLQSDAYGPMLDRVRKGIELMAPAIDGNDTQVALKIGQIEAKLERDYNRLLKSYTEALKQKKHTEDLTKALFVAHSVEQMGDVLKEISESIISANLGQPVNFERFHSLQDSVELLDAEENANGMQIEPIAETRSGSAISGVTAPDADDDAYVAIFKEGKKRKLKEERQGLKSWHEIYPGLAPRILSYKKRGQSAALLIEHLPGFTFEQILLNEQPELLQESLEQLVKTLKSIWRETRTEEPVCAHFMGQLAGRLDEVYKIHPEFRRDESRLCNVTVPSFDTLVTRAGEREKLLIAPFSVYIHGDFNVDNIIYDPMEQRINFIDLHRSRYMDYVQDVSVFMVSNYRLQILDKPLRRRIMNLAQDFCRDARRFASKVGDDTFEQRLALGLARSFATSTRFILDKSLARSMFLRARYLIDLLLAADSREIGDFKVPIKEIFVG